MEELRDLACRLVRRGYSLETVVTQLLTLQARPSDEQVENAIVSAFAELVRENISFVRQRAAG